MGGQAITWPDVYDRLANLMHKIGRERTAERLRNDTTRGRCEEVMDAVVYLDHEIDQLRRSLSTLADAEATREYTEEQALHALTHPAMPMMMKALETYRTRRGTYGPSEQKFADVMLAFFPNGLTLSQRDEWVRFGLFVQIVSKWSRYTNNFSRPHVDSSHDASVYGFMLEAEDRRSTKEEPFDLNPNANAELEQVRLRCPACEYRWPRRRTQVLYPGNPCPREDEHGRCMGYLEEDK